MRRALKSMAFAALVGAGAFLAGCGSMCTDGAPADTRAAAADGGT